MKLKPGAPFHIIVLGSFYRWVSNDYGHTPLPTAVAVAAAAAAAGTPDAVPTWERTYRGVNVSH
jgi:hypothetical protein